MERDNIKDYINASVSAENEENLNDIAWKYELGDIILTLADRQGFEEPEHKLDLIEKELLIGDTICVFLAKVYSDDVTSEGDSSESQSTLNKDLG